MAISGVADPAADAGAVSGRDEALLRAAEDVVVRERRAGADRLRVAREWALAHRVTMHEVDDRGRRLPGGLGERAGRLSTDPRDVARLGAASVPVEVYSPGELAVALRMHPGAAKRLMADAVDLHDRLPHTWAAVQALELQAWVARKIAALTGELDCEAARGVDAQIADRLDLPTGRLLSVVEARVVAADPVAAEARAEQARRRRLVHLGRETEHGTRSIFARCGAADAARFAETCDQIAKLLAKRTGTTKDSPDAETLDQLRARAVGILADPQAALDLLAGRDPRKGRAVVYCHTTAEQLFGLTGADVARVEDLGPHTRAMLADLLGHDQITLRPVIDLNQGVAADCYEIPTDIAERVHLAKPGDCFPYAENTSRATDIDHTVAYDPNGPPGQTAVDNLGHLTRYHHRIKTHAPGWQVEQLPGHRYLWTTPTGRVILVDSRGTHRVTATRSQMEARLEATFTDLVLAS